MKGKKHMDQETRIKDLGKSLINILSFELDQVESREERKLIIRARWFSKVKEIALTIRQTRQD